MTKKITRPVSILLTILMIIGIFSIVPVMVSARGGEPIPYLDENGETQYAEQYAELTDASTSLYDGWYVVNSDITISSRIDCAGDVHLILCDGCTLNAEKGISISSGEYSLYIYGQSEGAGTINANSSRNYPGIGYAPNTNIVDGGGMDGIFIYGGTINATAGAGGAGIGGGYQSIPYIEIYGGTITAQGGSMGAGIGGGYSGGASIRIYGGTITATGGSQSAGIGGGGSSQFAGIAHVYIFGGTIEAYGNGNAAAIGGGGTALEDGGEGYVYIYGGNITAINNKSYSDLPIGIGNAQNARLGADVVINWNDPTASIYSTGYGSNTVKLNGIFTDGESFYSGTIDDTEDLAEKTLRPAVYTVTWKNGDEVLETDEYVYINTIPEYNGVTPARAATAQYTYTFSGWTDGNNTYGLNDELPAVTGDATYTAVFDQAERKVAYAVLDRSSNTLTFKYDSNMPSEYAWEVSDTGSRKPSWGARITKVVFEDSFKDARPRSTVGWFDECTSLNEIEGLNSLNTSQVTSMKDMFCECRGLETLDVSTFDTSNVTDMNGMFLSCSSLTELDISSFDIENVEDTSYMFGSCGNLETIWAADKNVDWSEGFTGQSTRMFINCSSLKGEPDGIAFDSSVIDISGAKANGGYFSYVPVLYTVTWKNGDEVLETDENVPYGATPTYDGALPDDYIESGTAYEFTGWSPSITPVTGDATYTATFGRVSRLHVFVKNMTVSPIETFFVKDIEPSDTIASLKEKIAEKSGISAARQRLIFGGRELADNTTLADNNVQKESTVHLLMKTPKLVTGHSITLNGNVNLNFYMNPELVNAGDTVSFTWDKGACSYTVQEADLVDGKGYMAAVELPAAEMTYPITASVEGVDQTDVCSVRDYCDEILNPESDFSAAYMRENGEAKYNKLVGLVKAMLDYGAKAQDAFGLTDVAYANADVDYTMQPVDTDMVTAAIAAANGAATADDLNEVADALRAKYFTTSLFFLSANTLRHYFTPADGSETMVNPDAYTDNRSDYYYYVEKADIPAAELDDMQTFNVGGVEFYYSALDYVNAILNSGMDAKYKNLAKALYWYNQAANDFFDTPAHVHTPGDPEHENVAATSCTQTGSYGEVTYCTVCSAVLGSVHVGVPATGHTLVSVAEVPATADSNGVQAQKEPAPTPTSLKSERRSTI